MMFVSTIREYLVSLGRNKKQKIQIFCDSVFLLICLTAFVVVNDGFASTTELIDSILVISIACIATLITFAQLRVFKTSIRFISRRILMLLVLGTSVSTISLTLLLVLFGVNFSPLNLIFYFLVSSICLTTYRGIAHLVLNPIGIMKNGVEYVAIYGVGSSARQLSEYFKLSNQFSPKIFIDNQLDLDGVYINGLKVVSVEKFLQTHLGRQIHTVIIANEDLQSSSVSGFLTLVENNQLKIKIVPSLEDLVAGKEVSRKIRDLSIEDLLGREPTPPLTHLIGKNVNKKAVMITGAGGSIGSELCKQVLNNNPTKIVLVEISEFALYEISKYLSDFALANKISTEIIPKLCSVVDEENLRNLLISYQIDTLYHAAAYKHVTLVEQNIVSAVSNNVFGTNAVVEAADAAKTPNCIIISTDKAVRPTNIMGATKRLSEKICLAKSLGAKDTSYAIVRFGNVVGSSGSVIPLFQNQIKVGGPITVTHPDVTRYFMTISEAAQLVLHAGAMSNGSDIFVLDMGDPIKILDIAKRMARLSGFVPVVNSSGTEKSFTLENHTQLEINFCGLRPGEKLFEELFISDNIKPSEHNRIFISDEGTVDSAEVAETLKRLKKATDKRQPETVIKILQEANVGFQHLPNSQSG